MVRVELTEKESAVLTEVLESSLGEMKTEIAHTDNHDYRLSLKEREIVIEHILTRMMSSPHS